MNDPASIAPSRGALWRLWLSSWLLFLCTAHGNLETVDAAITMHSARALWLRGDPGLRPSSANPEWLAERVIADEILRLAAEGKHVNGRRGKDGVQVYAWFPIGHVFAMVPFVALGQALAPGCATIEARYQERAADRYFYGMFVTEHAAVAMLLPSLCGATSVVLLLLLGLALGASRRDAAIATFAIVAATQFFPLTRESTSDGPGMTGLLAALSCVVRLWRGQAGIGTALLGGIAAGAMVLLRSAHAPLLMPLGLALVAAARQHRRWSWLSAFAGGGLPFLVLLLWANWQRFGDVTDTGYPKVSDWFNYPLLYGVAKLLIAGGKGILWFTPLLWLALPLSWRRADVPALRWLGWSLFAIPMLMFGSTPGWQSGQCWGNRYVTPGIVGLLAIALPQARPWARWPRTFAVLFGVGILLNATSLLAPTRGHNQLAGQAVTAMYDQQLARGEITAAARASVDPADHFFFLPRFSPLHANWTWAWRAATGGFEDTNGVRRDGAAYTTLPLFGVDSDNPLLVQGPLHWEDRGFRHLWFVFFGALTGVPWWALLLPPLLLAVWLLRCSARDWRR
ncbi:MAG: hypothetical protein IPK26_05040 [Planctomycetes bacterium]|nr:hypothetical protein [Planctomycetota bacterium]